MMLSDEGAMRKQRLRVTLLLQFTDQQDKQRSKADTHKTVRNYRLLASVEGATLSLFAFFFRLTVLSFSYPFWTVRSVNG